MPLGKLLILTGLGFVLAGLLLTFGPRLPWLGRLPGDFRLEREHFSIYIPLGTCLLLSLLLSLLLWLLRR
jgi:hypothetical protein